MKEGTILITLKTTNSDGTSKEVTFTDHRQCVTALRDLLGEGALKTENQRLRDETNNALRSAWRAREVDPSVFFSRGNKSE